MDDQSGTRGDEHVANVNHAVDHRLRTSRGSARTTDDGVTDCVQDHIHARGQVPIEVTARATCPAEIEGGLQFSVTPVRPRNLEGRHRIFQGAQPSAPDGEGLKHLVHLRVANAREEGVGITRLNRVRHGKLGQIGGDRVPRQVGEALAHDHTQRAVLGKNTARDHPQGRPRLCAILEQVHIRLDVRPNQAIEVLDGDVRRIDVRRGRVHRLIEMHHHAHLILRNAVVVEGQLNGNATGLIGEIQLEVDRLTAQVHEAGVQIVRGDSRRTTQADGRRTGHGIQEQSQGIR